MDYAIEILNTRRRDHLAAASGLEAKIGGRDGPGYEAELDSVRHHRVRAEELERAIAVLRKNAHIVNAEDA